MVRRLPRSSALAAALLLSVTVFALVANGRGQTHVSAQGNLPWVECGAPYQCATLRVPLDYANANSRTIELALVRTPARDPSKRVGSLLVNPGGPGASGVDFARSIATSFPVEIRDRFDIVGFDPRGVAGSTPLLCHDKIQQLAASEPEPSNDDQWAEVTRITRDFATLCGQRGGDMLAHLGSLDVVRDMDRIREAVGDEKLTYVGFSYGTLLGELYADRFPTRVRALVLDGPIDPGLTADEATAQQAIGFERAIDGFDASCKQRSCPLSEGGKDAWSAIKDLVDQARTRPIPAPGLDRPAGPGEVLLGAFQALYRPFSWRALERAVAEARNGDASTFVRLADAYLGRQSDGSYANQLEMNAAVNCLDYEYSRDLTHYRALADELVKVAPRIGRSMASGGLGCALWPVASQPVDVTGATGAPPVLIVGTTNDPATPFEWALAARKAIPSGVLLTHEGDGHTVYLSGVRCVDDVVNAYLLNGATPQDGSICGNNADPPRAAPTVPAQAIVATPTLPSDRNPSPNASTTSTPRAPATGTGPAQSVAPSPTPDTTMERGIETSIGLRLLAVAVLATIVALIVVTRRRMMRF